MRQFVHPESIVRTIWGRGDTVLLIFAGASAEFALNKSVDWLYFTGRLPADPLGRLFSTVAYAQRIVFADEKTALGAIDSITAIHRGVEAKRGARIPATAYLDVLFMLIGYSIASFELLERPLRAEEREEVFDVFKRVGDRMGLVDLPATFPEWQARRTQYLQTNLEYSKFSRDLYRSYRRNLGWLRYQVLIQTQVLLVPGPVRRMLGFSSIPWLYPVVLGYRFSRFLHLDKAIKVLLLPPQYRAQAYGLDH